MPPTGRSTSAISRWTAVTTSISISIPCGRRRTIDAIGIDVYWPLADWRDGREHLDYLAGTRSIYDVELSEGNVQGGEGFDWYYASQASRDNQVRSPINDSYGKPWVFRYKDIKSWWLNAHYNRPGGVESATATAWVPQSKPFWFMEIGCPAVDKGANQPNVFVDPKSSESAYPYYSSGVRDDLMQRRFLKAFIHAFDWTKPGYVADANPVSGVTGAAHGRSRSHPRLLLGRAAVIRLFRSRRTSGAMGQLAVRPLAERAARQRAARPNSSPSC